MTKVWSTKEHDMQLAQSIMEQYAEDQDSHALGLFELVVNLQEKRMNFRLSAWVLALADKFHSMYGPDKGDFVIRQIVSRCLVQGHTLH